MGFATLGTDTALTSAGIVLVHTSWSRTGPGTRKEITLTTEASRWDPLHSTSPTTAWWNTTNYAEAMPGVLTPLGWTVWSQAGEIGGRAALCALGAIPERDVAIPRDTEARIFNIFFGRVAGRVDFFFRIGDLIPGTSGEAVVTQILGFLPPGFVSRPSRRRWPIIFVRLPVTFLRVPSATRRARLETDAWWQAELARSGQLDLDTARTQFKNAIRRFAHNMSVQGTAVLCAIQPVYDLLSRLAAAAGVDATTLMSGQGSHEETGVVEDLWTLSRGRIDLPAFLLRHGYHGPRAGEISTLVWREDPSPVEQMLDGYKTMGEEADPVRADLVRAEQRRRMERQFVSALPPTRRVPARLLLSVARHYLPLRGVGKVAYLQSLDVARAAARRIGACLAANGVLDAPEDVFFLTADELLQGIPADARELVAARRSRYEHYCTLCIPSAWAGNPEPKPASTETAPWDGILNGIGVSPGRVEGRVQVVTDPAVAEFEPGDILVAHTTDPSWASLMFLSKGLVVDIGGLLSHAAVVARELGIPCVMNTQIGTDVLRSGDICRVDGSTGTVEVLIREPG